MSGQMARPRVKPEHGPYRIADGKIRIGGVSYGVAGELDDPDGWIWTLLLAMDGNRGPDDIVTAVCDAHPGLGEQTVRDALAQLIRAGFVEDVGAPPPAALTERDLERYDRSMRFFRWVDLTPRTSSWEPQLALHEARVTVLGVGGTGGVAAQALAATGVGRLHLVDFDIVELSNLCRQVLYSEADIGRPKTEAALDRLRNLNSDIRITAEHLRAGSARDVARLLPGCDVLMLGADKPPELRTWVNRACIQAGRPWVDAGYHGPRTQVGVYVPGKGACWECTRIYNRERHLAIGADPDGPEGHMGAVWSAVGAVSAGISGYLAAHQVIALITGIPAVTPGRINAVNLSALDTPFVIDDPPHPDCPACAVV
jgi:molybdopterin/thiamine biosynthesis adenylyltransferase